MSKYVKSLRYMVLKKWLDVFSFGLYYKKHINKGYENTKEVINFTW